MQLKQRDLDGHLQGSPARVYLVSGDEPLLVDEAADAIRRAILASGVSERERHHVEPAFDWNRLLQDSQSLSLFGDRKLIEVHLPRPTPGDAGGKVLAELAGNLGEDHLLVVTTRLDRTQQRAAWVKALDRAGVHLPIWPVERDRLPRWLADRARRTGVTLPDGGVERLVEATEGNLLAAAQELEKLRLLGVSRSWTDEQLVAALADSTRFETLASLDAAYAGDAARTVQVLRTQRLEGTHVAALLPLLAADVRRLGEWLHEGGAGRSVHFSRKNAVEAALRRLAPRDQQRALKGLAAVDGCAKGAIPHGGDAWEMLERVLVRLALAGRRRAA
jgi:DNA polymerase-3 subunit delta